MARDLKTKIWPRVSADIGSEGGGSTIEEGPVQCTAVGEVGVFDCPTQMTVQSTTTNAKEHNREIWSGG